MTVAINYWLIIPLAVVIVVLIIWLVKRDRTDEKSFEKTIINSEMPEKHNHDNEVTK